MSILQPYEICQEELRLNFSWTCVLQSVLQTYNEANVSFLYNKNYILRANSLDI